MLVQEQRAEGERIARYHALELPGGEMSAVLDRQDRRFTMDAELDCDAQTKTSAPLVLCDASASLGRLAAA